MKKIIKNIFDNITLRKKLNTYKITCQTLMEEYKELEEDLEKANNKIKELKKEIKNLKKENNQKSLNIKV